jgi:hypothetical protein
MQSHNPAASDDEPHDASADDASGGDASSDDAPSDQDSAEAAVAPDALAGNELRAEGLILERAIGGWRGMVDSGLPTVVFITVYIVAGRDLAPALIAAVVTGSVLAIYRLIRRQRLQQVLTGFLGLAVAAGFSAWTGQAENFFLPGLITNVVYGSAFIVSILVGWPLLGVAMGYLTGDGTRWRSDKQLVRTYAAASWVWVGVFFGRLIVQVPLYLAAAVEVLGVARIVMGWPLFLGAAYVTYRVLAPVYRERRESNESASDQ